MIYSYRNHAVRLIYDNVSSDFSDVVLPIHGIKTVKVIDFDPVGNYLYWVRLLVVSIPNYGISIRKYF